MNFNNYTTLLRIPVPLTALSTRSLARIPLHEYHVRFDVTVGKKIPCPDVLDRFKRLNNGVWIRGIGGRKTRRYTMDERKATTSMQHVICSKIESQMLDKLTSRFWVRPKYFIEDPYAAYHVRHGLPAPRVDYSGRFVRERPKILMDDTSADQHFYDR